MLTLLTITHVIVSVFLIAIVLLQHGKGADMGASFGGGSGKTVFGTEGPLPLLSKITTASAIIFMFTSVGLAYYSANVTKSSVMKSLPATAPVEKKVETAPTPVEVPMPGNHAGTTEEKATPAAQFPGEKAPAAPTEPVKTGPTNKQGKEKPAGKAKEKTPTPPKG